MMVRFTIFSINHVLNICIYKDSGLKEWINLLHETKKFEPKMLSSDEEIIVSLVKHHIITQKQLPRCIFS